MPRRKHFAMPFCVVELLNSLPKGNVGRQIRGGRAEDNNAPLPAGPQRALVVGRGAVPVEEIQRKEVQRAVVHAQLGGGLLGLLLLLFLLLLERRGIEGIATMLVEVRRRAFLFTRLAALLLLRPAACPLMLLIFAGVSIPGKGAIIPFFCDRRLLLLLSLLPLRGTTCRPTRPRAKLLLKPRHKLWGLFGRQSRLAFEYFPWGCIRAEEALA